MRNCRNESMSTLDVDVVKLYVSAHSKGADHDLVFRSRQQLKQVAENGGATGIDHAVTKAP